LSLKEQALKPEKTRENVKPFEDEREKTKNVGYGRKALNPELWGYYCFDATPEKPNGFMASKSRQEIRPESF
jgi:hypothetical protein